MEMCGCVGCQGVSSSRIVSTRNYWFNDQRKHLSKEQTPNVADSKSRLLWNSTVLVMPTMIVLREDPRLILVLLFAESKKVLIVIMIRWCGTDDDFRWVRGTQTCVSHLELKNDNLLPNEEETNCLQKPYNQKQQRARVDKPYKNPFGHTGLPSRWALK